MSANKNLDYNPDEVLKKIRFPSNHDWKLTLILPVEILEVLDKKIHLNHVESIGTYQFSCIFLLAYKNTEQLEKVLEFNFLTVENVKIHILKTPSKLHNIIVSWVPSFLKNDLIQKKFSIYGKVISLRDIYLQDKRFLGIKTTKKD